MERTRRIFMSVAVKIKTFLKGIYSVISVLSTLTIFTSLVLFLVGRLGFNNICDDDLIMQQIKNQLPDNLTISDIYIENIHGLENESIIVLASDGEGHQIANQLLIFDKIENDILNRINNLFGYGSNYRLSYSFSLEYLDERLSYLGYFIEIEYLIDLTGDLSKEIIIKFMPYPSGNGAYYETGIFSYSYEKHTYYLLGTYPCLDSSENQESEKTERNYYNKNETFHLVSGLKYYGEYLAQDEYGTVLIRTERIWGDDEANYDPHRYTISVFRPQYDTKNDELKWNKSFSKDTKKRVSYCSDEYITNFLKKNDINVRILDKL